ncbi:MAG: T9SS type A sorting domain-containing protein, partial [Chitinophagaceae bacterium]|nr:T9SS type A sorting domain-containing protein [Chitinophagaceae bacterium]
GTNWKNLAVGAGNTIAIKTDGTLWGWGNNGYLQLGSSTGLQYTPLQIGSSNGWQNISSGDNHTLAINADGFLYVCGINNYGQLGLGNTIFTLPFSPVGSANDWQSVSGGLEHSVAIKADGSLYTWGRNIEKQLGDGTTTTRTVPTAITCPTSNLAVSDFGFKNEIKVYPNPVKDLLSISFDNEITAVSVYNLLGQEVLTKYINANEANVDVSSLSSGTYLVKVTSNDLVKTLKIIKN